MVLVPKPPNTASRKSPGITLPLGRTPRGLSWHSPRTSVMHPISGRTPEPWWWDCCARLWAVRQFVWLEVGSGKMALSRPGRALRWYPIPPTSTPAEYAGAYPQGAPQTQTVRRLAKSIDRLDLYVMESNKP